MRCFYIIIASVSAAALWHAFACWGRCLALLSQYSQTFLLWAGK